MPRLCAGLGVPVAIAVAIAVALLQGKRAPPPPDDTTTPATATADSALSRSATAAEFSAGPLNRSVADRGTPVEAETQLMAKAQGALERSPAQALLWLEQADEQFGRMHEQRRVLEIKALVRLQRIGLAHARAAQFYRHFPASDERATVERLTGYHPRPWGPGER